MDKFARSVNGLAVRAGDKIKLFGQMPDDPVVGYVGEMVDMLRDQSEKLFTVSTTDHLGRDKWVVHVAGWNWDPRNIYKPGDESKLPPPPDPVTFDVTTLDV